jgi:hypothetical protein
MKKIHLFPFLFISFLSCQKEENLIAPEVDERLTFFFESFKKEGSSRGQNINMEDIIDKLFWETANMTEKEYVIFHELGHCALNRRHLDATNKDGTCTSMMQSGNGSCKMVYNAQNRSKYLDELFSQ